MPIFRRPCFREIKRHVIAPRVNSGADGTIHLAEKLFTPWKWPSERASHRESDHASPSLCVSTGGLEREAERQIFHVEIPIKPPQGIMCLTSPIRSLTLAPSDPTVATVNSTWLKIWQMCTQTALIVSSLAACLHNVSAELRLTGIPGLLRTTWKRVKFDYVQWNITTRFPELDLDAERKF